MSVCRPCLFSVVRSSASEFYECVVQFVGRLLHAADGIATSPRLLRLLYLILKSPCQGLPIPTLTPAFRKEHTKHQHFIVWLSPIQDLDALYCQLINAYITADCLFLI